MSTPEDHIRLFDLVERYAVVKSCGKFKNKYLYFQDRKYWHIGNPKFDYPEDWLNVINRTWEDARQHAADVSHRWTGEDVALYTLHIGGCSQQYFA